MARTAARTPGLSTSTSTAGAPWWSMTRTVTPGGQTCRTWSRNCAATVLGSWSGTRRKLSLAPGLAGEDRLGARALVAAVEAVDVAGRPGPLPLERRVAGLALQRRDAEARPGTRPPRTAAWRTRPAPSPPAAGRRRRTRRSGSGRRAPSGSPGSTARALQRVGDRAAEGAGVEVAAWPPGRCSSK